MSYLLLGQGPIGFIEYLHVVNSWSHNFCLYDIERKTIGVLVIFPDTLWNVDKQTCHYLTQWLIVLTNNSNTNNLLCHFLFPEL